MSGIHELRCIKQGIPEILQYLSNFGMVLWNPQDIYGALFGGIIIALVSSFNHHVLNKKEGLHTTAKTIFNYRQQSTFDFFWNMSFIFGLITAPYAFSQIYGLKSHAFNREYTFFDRDINTVYHLSTLGWFISGFMIGFGSEIGSGYISGHGYCASATLTSKRTVLSTIVMIAAGMILATIRFYHPFLSYIPVNQPPETLQKIDLSAPIHTVGFYTAIRWITTTIFVLLAINFIYHLAKYVKRIELFVMQIAGFIIGAIYGLGLMVSGALRPSKIIGFLTLNSGWDPTILILMFTIAVADLIIYQFIKVDAHIPGERYRQQQVDREDVYDIHGFSYYMRIFIGSILFGLGWALVGICPGTGMPALFIYSHALFWAIGFVISTLLSKLFDFRIHKMDLSARSERLLENPEEARQFDMKKPIIV